MNRANICGDHFKGIFWSTASGYDVSVGQEVPPQTDMQISCTLQAVAASTHFNSDIPGIIATVATGSPIFSGGTTPRAIVAVKYSFRFGADKTVYVIPITRTGASYMHLMASSGHDRAMEEALQEAFYKTVRHGVQKPAEFRAELEAKAPQLIIR